MTFSVKMPIVKAYIIIKLQLFILKKKLTKTIGSYVRFSIYYF